MTCQGDKGFGGQGPYDKGLQKGEPKIFSCSCFSGSIANPWCEVGKLIVQAECLSPWSLLGGKETSRTFGNLMIQDGTKFEIWEFEIAKTSKTWKAKSTWQKEVQRSAPHLDSFPFETFAEIWNCKGQANVQKRKKNRQKVLMDRMKFFQSQCIKENPTKEKKPSWSPQHHGWNLWRGFGITSGRCDLIKL